VRHRALVWEMDDFEPEDIARISGHYLGQANDQLDFDKIHRFAPALNGYQIKNACLWLAKRDNEITTESYIDFLRLRNLTGNVDMEEVESVDWTDLKGLTISLRNWKQRSLCRLRTTLSRWNST